MLAIIDYKAGNLTSVKLSLETLEITGTITSAPEVVAKADRIIFPGVGAAGSAMQNLRDFGLDGALRDAVKRGTPLLGICVGMQVLLDFSEEDGGTDLLGLIPGSVVRFQPKNTWDKVPQMGWNNVSWNGTALNNAALNNKSDAANKIFSGIESGSDFYFVHSYYPVPKDADAVLAETEYADVRFASALCYENIIATQFHPEKSGRNGLKLLENFVRF